MIKAVIFDLDDTLISETEYVKSGFRQISKILNKDLNIAQEEIYSNLWSLFLIDRKNVFNRFYELNKISYTKEDIEKLITEYRNHKPEIQFFKDVIPFITFLKEKQIVCCIITDGFSYAQKQKLSALNAYQLFDEIVVTDDYGSDYSKPNIKAFNLIKDKFNLDYSEMIYIGDNPVKDFYIGYLCPIKTVRIIREKGIYKEEEYLNGIKENYRINTLNDLKLI